MPILPRGAFRAQPEIRVLRSGPRVGFSSQRTVPNLPLPIALRRAVSRKTETCERRPTLTRKMDSTFVETDEWPDDPRANRNQDEGTKRI